MRQDKNYKLFINAFLVFIISVLCVLSINTYAAEEAYLDFSEYADASKTDILYAALKFTLEKSKRKVNMVVNISSAKEKSDTDLTALKIIINGEEAVNIGLDGDNLAASDSFAVISKCDKQSEFRDTDDYTFDIKITFPDTLPREIKADIIISDSKGKSFSAEGIVLMESSPEKQSTTSPLTEKKKTDSTSKSTKDDTAAKTTKEKPSTTAKVSVQQADTERERDITDDLNVNKETAGQTMSDEQNTEERTEVDFQSINIMKVIGTTAGVLLIFAAALLPLISNIKNCRSKEKNNIDSTKKGK